ncbi:hypothetical protein [Mycobacterium sp.]|uniref:hypothetical protein n=1 Tax=Mycobacterium sp. TaxID=1785 RepID=UPI002D3D8520|nr:hypothetical protein [Mycobacterium sp.]HZA09131.1 hypothetical protein [Mycobacterium sp.]
MIVTGAFLADRAASVERKLHVWGGVLDRCEVGLDRIARFVLVVLTQTEASDRRQGGRLPKAKVDVEIIPPAGDSQTMHLDIPEAAFGGENGFATFYLGIRAPTDGRYVLLVTVGAHNISLPLMVYASSQAY